MAFAVRGIKAKWLAIWAYSSVNENETISRGS
jgi:hypothetical protein